MSGKLSAIPLMPVFLIASVSWLLHRVKKDYEEWGRLSTQASAVGWTLYVLHAGLTLSAARNASGEQLPLGRASAGWFGGVLMLSGAALFWAGVYEFRSFEQMSGLQAGNLVKSGPYRFSRNPQVVGWGVSLLGAALAGRSAQALLLAAAFFIVHRLQAPIEERHLKRVFGEEYRHYSREVPRFLGLPKAR